ncbi:Proteolipid membrane potential modulator [Penicillium longicatenatum]|uniref:Proteolipid membrane potential modulator n=1 Tax=Penicillium longicatenatum TaxID=1561947 RepID=UPI0025493D67|nr:Proteolipid membrane potential modulator [Penicillium longicatenatum]KAJ5649677.1 Proteolipid membrane potential modulator [Penicillium longicatenatum]KAJ5672791.1 Proteolipid membrane potential modulator [Penicillium longicatenatum]
MASACSMLCVIIITIFIPPLGVFLTAGCGVDFWINVLLTILGYFPGHIHAFYLEYVYYHRRKQDPMTRATQRPAPGVYSDRVQNGGHSNRNYGTV